LAIIGVIAAITIPSIVANHQKRTLETQFAKAYRTFSQAINLAMAEHGSTSSWEFKPNMSLAEQDEFVKKYFKPYLNTVKFCSAQDAVRNCFPNVVYKNLNGSDWGNLNGSQNPGIVLADGIICRFKILNSRIIEFIVDINGAKKPNKLGEDVFIFSLLVETGEFLPSGIYSSWDNEAGVYIKTSEEEVNTSCSRTGIGWDCAVRVVQDGFKINY